MTDRLDEAIVQLGALSRDIKKDGNDRLAEWADTIREQLERHRDANPTDYMPRLDA